MIEATLDFHTFGKITAEQALLQLDLFLQESYTEKFHAVLVITGKGNNAPQKGKGLLRTVISSSLRHHNLVKSFRTADPWNGGEGAFEVSLKDC